MKIAMNSYKVEITERVIKEYTIEAETEEDAELLAVEGHKYEQEDDIPEKYDVHVSHIELLDI